jgi:dephospho-CoA kinase
VKKIKVGITGGIGTGKTTLCEIIKSKGYTVLSADDIAKEIMVNDSSVKDLIKAEFGNEAYIDEKINTNFLAEKVFTDEQNIMIINSIVHPPTISKMNEEMNTALQNDKLVFAESALIFEAEFEAIFDYIILVTANEENKIKRVMQNKKLSRDEVEKRIANQIPDDEKRKGSDFVIENNSTLDEFKTKADFVLSLIENMAGI